MPEPDSFPSQTKQSRQRHWMPLLLSVCSHLALVLALVVSIWRLPKTAALERERGGEIVLAVVDKNDQTQYLDDSKFEQASRQQQKTPPSSAATAESALPPAIAFPEAAVDLPGLPIVRPSDSAAALASKSTASMPEVPYELSAEGLELIEADQKLIRDRQPKGPPTSISVFGSDKLTGRRFVFLIDRSQSMGDQGLGVLKQSRIELSRAINRLEEHHLFQVVLYHNSTGTIGRRELLPATLENKRRVPAFLGEILAFGGTNHEGGLYSAMAFRPDIIVMMTDGGSPELNEGKLNAIKRTAGRTQIHTIKFGFGPASDNGNFLRRLSELTTGTYRYVDVNDWRK